MPLYFITLIHLFLIVYLLSRVILYSSDCCWMQYGRNCNKIRVILISIVINCNFLYLLFSITEVLLFMYSVYLPNFDLLL